MSHLRAANLKGRPSEPPWSHEPLRVLEVHLCRNLRLLTRDFHVPLAIAEMLAASTAAKCQATQGSVAGTAGDAKALLYRRTTSTVCQRILSN